MKKLFIILSVTLGIAAISVGSTQASFFGSGFFNFSGFSKITTKIFPLKNLPILSNWFGPPKPPSNPPPPNNNTCFDLEIDIDGVVYDPLCCKTIFKRDDMKPGDFGEETLSLHVNQYACGFVKFDLKRDRDNGCSEPESLVDPTCGNPGKWQGELNDQVRWRIWKDEGGVAGWQCGNTPKCSADALEGDNIFNGLETIWIQGELTGDRSYALGELKPSQIPYYGVAWCFGDWGAGMACSGAGLGNEAQTDSFSVNIIFRAEQKSGAYPSGCPTNQCQRSTILSDNAQNSNCGWQIETNVENEKNKLSEMLKNGKLNTQEYLRSLEFLQED